MKIKNCICDSIIFQQGPDGGAGSPGNPGVPGTKVNLNLCDNNIMNKRIIR